MTEQKHGVQPREGGPRSLYCYDCGEWVPNTANHEMAREGYFAHSHSCKQGEQKHMSKEAYCSLCEVQCDTNPEILRLRAENGRLVWENINLKKRLREAEAEIKEPDEALDEYERC